MKHTWKVTLYLVLLFLVSQVVGLYVTSHHLPGLVVGDNGVTEVVNATAELAFGTERPETSSGYETLGFILGAILFGTILLLILIKFRQKKVWKAWFFLAVTMCVTFTVGTFINHNIAFAIGLLMAFFKVVRPNIWVHNVSEVLIYGAMGAIFVPMEYMTLWVGFVLLFLISLYDMYAVWKSKHMVKLAKFQTESKVFAGLMFNYAKTKDGKDIKIKGLSSKKKLDVPDAPNSKTKKVKVESHTAILGGGDIAFPLLFSGVVLKGLMVTYNFWIAFGMTLIISFTAAGSLLYLFYIAEKGKFYPAMPFVTAGCLAGYGIVYLLQMII